MTCFYWDGIVPNINNLSLKLNNISSWWNILATSNANLEFSYDDTNWWWSPNIIIYYQLEKKDDASFSTEDSITLNTNNSSANQTITWDISKVVPWTDFDINKWWRQYSIKITKICDEAWNCIDNSGNGWEYSWWVFANTPVWYETIDSSDLDNIKIWDNKDIFNLKLTLQD